MVPAVARVSSLAGELPHAAGVDRINKLCKCFVNRWLHNTVEIFSEHLFRPFFFFKLKYRWSSRCSSVVDESD